MGTTDNTNKYIANISGIGSENYIFFLKDAANILPPWFFSLATTFIEHSIKIIPVTFEQFKDFNKKKSGVSYLIIASTDFKNKTYFTSIIKNHLELASITGKICIFHICSFENIVNSALLKRSRQYHCYSLPINLESLVTDIAYKYYLKIYDGEKWPWGKKTKLQTL